ncbi:DNA phosphorothioation-associated protein 4 [Aphanothece hegewaldii CCALA 016]|uniref:DNA phosphorothioation-associated protein 4 n=1 Tax=Aphanothece hegewaldii CCALA 016 TaxID=2107694 RepID=A0A2T1M0Z5_9CHRO|nr:DNA phosphorothioation-associated protein 4 [Aphanothece hegewaldii]PSF38351.1 DNA phosphorothioation-associated protein 4 [Aphanothece hegewaldii CCALA 016]
MSIHRVRIAKDKAEFVQSLVDFNGNYGPFQTYADAIAFAAALGMNAKKRVALGMVAKEPAPINLEIFISRGYDSLVKLLAVAATQDLSILSVYDAIAEAQRVEIFEEYANGGLEQLQEELKGSVDYTERLLLMLNTERLKEQISDSDFDLGKFL